MLYTCLSLFYNVFHLKNFPTNGYITTPQTVTLHIFLVSLQIVSPQTVTLQPHRRLHYNPTDGYITTPQTVTLRFVSHCFSTICKPLTIIDNIIQEKTLKDNIKKRCFSFFLTYTFIGGYNGA